MFDMRHGTSLESESIYAQFSKTCVETTFPVPKILASVEKPYGRNSSASCIGSLRSRTSTLTRNYGGFCGLCTYRGLEGTAQNLSNNHGSSRHLLAQDQLQLSVSLSPPGLSALEKCVSPFNNVFVQVIRSISS